MNLMRHEPPAFPLFREMEEFSERLNRFFGPRFRGNGEKESLVVTDWTPFVDIQETETEYLVKAELPEVKKEDVKVTVENGVLMHRGRTQAGKGRKGKEVSPDRALLRHVPADFHRPDGHGGDQGGGGLQRRHPQGRICPKTEKPRPRAMEVKVV